MSAQPGHPDQSAQHRFTVLLSHDQRDQLRALQKATGFSAALIIRRAVAAYTRHYIEARPTCANGHPCCCPHTWHKHQAGLGPHRHEQQPLPEEEAEP